VHHSLTHCRQWLGLSFLLAFALLLSGCLGSEARDLRIHPQTPSAHTPLGGVLRLAPEEVQTELADRFLAHHFSPWRTAALPDETLFWGIARYRKTQLYDAGGWKRPDGWFEELAAESARESFPNAGHRAVTIRATSLRVMPTAEGAYLKPRWSGSGYPFDYFQNSALWANTPVRIVHVSASGAWVLAETALASGWLPAHDVAVVDDGFAESFESTWFVAITRDRVPVRDERGGYRFTTGIGSLHPVSGYEDGSWRILIAVSDETGRAVPMEGLLPYEAAAPFPLALTAGSIAGLSDRMTWQAYGWGGMDGRRDCSALLRDLFAGFGLWLPRNSAQQARVGTVVSLEGLSMAQKEQLILEQGVPFLTLLWRPGHIMLLVGEQDGRPLVWHQVWGVRTWDLLRKEGRLVIGRSAVTTLTPGEERANVPAERSLLATVKTMNILVDR
jgi:hypothetical protein